MKKMFAQLRPMERRLAVGVLVILILALNWAFIWPHFSDVSKLERRRDYATKLLATRQTAIADTKKYQDLVNSFEGTGTYVPAEDQAINFLQTIKLQAAASGVQIFNFGRQSARTNQFFSEQSEAISVTATDAQLVDFLYKLGENASMVRVRDLDLQPDQPHQHLNANIQLVASYQKKLPATASQASGGIKSAPTAVSAAGTNSKPATVKSK